MDNAYCINPLFWHPCVMYSYSANIKCLPINYNIVNFYCRPSAIGHVIGNLTSSYTRTKLKTINLIELPGPIRGRYKGVYQFGRPTMYVTAKLWLI